MASLGSYDPELQQFCTAAIVNWDALRFLRWAVAHGRLRGDSETQPATATWEITPCTGDPPCDICPPCTAVTP